ncbi:hypothetical protein FOCG_07810 [Fusarium oxysporum f. sp. radicis-lycopersici 26381]|uniref:Uncharacterized protein n=1 Tax=Fusarium oxysporum Fo47 TaxID=660027 RepID=W9JFH3_FUSOX|nr:hypothetical protein FOZG_16144 [Fusarium oxysporum Fo47]EWZ85124.1 hypothetical protein FOWG_11637 [Fusarium oxysporum f. sp. lycopersici MN25]EXL51997.1 hypothetical protein FOCG_07810 [Fusarium oxysporum f. sp. radicis-lycopersici 26381]
MDSGTSQHTIVDMLERHQTKSRHKRLPALPGWPWPRAWWRFALFDLLASPFGAAAATAEAGSRSGGEAKTYLTFALSLILAKKPRPESKSTEMPTNAFFQSGYCYSSYDASNLNYT